MGLEMNSKYNVCVYNNNKKKSNCWILFENYTISRKLIGKDTVLGK